MASDNVSNAPEIVPELENEDYFDASNFLSAKCAWKYDKYLGRAVVKEQRIYLKKLEVGMPDFYGWVVSSKWMCFALSLSRLTII